MMATLQCKVNGVKPAVVRGQARLMRPLFPATVELDVFRDKA